MRLLVYPHELAIGGSQINAIDLAAGAAEAGHDVIVYGVSGPLVEYLASRGLRFIPAHPLKYRPAPTRILELARIAHRERLDLIHAYEWPPCLDAYYGAGFVRGTPVLCTVLSMTVMPYIPASVPLIMGTEELGQEARRSHRGKVWVIEPPIDTARDNPSIEGSEFRRAHGVGPDNLLVVSVSRLAVDLKLDALVRAIDAVDHLADRHPVKLILLGGGPAQAALSERAQAVNARRGREVVAIPGPSLDPRAAYAAADVVVGMGSSALRALSIGRPVIVQGEAAFSLVFEPKTLAVFLKQGFYGVADSAPGAGRLATQIESLLVDAERRAALGRFGREIVIRHFSLEAALSKQLKIYDEVLAQPSPYRLVEATRAAARALALEIKNHDPRFKKRRNYRNQVALEAARRGGWPPAEGLKKL